MIRPLKFTVQLLVFIRKIWEYVNYIALWLSRAFDTKVDIFFTCFSNEIWIISPTTNCVWLVGNNFLHTQLHKYSYWSWAGLIWEIKFLLKSHNLKTWIKNFSSQESKLESDYKAGNRALTSSREKLLWEN